MGYDLYEKQQDLIRQLDVAVKQLRKTGQAYGGSYARYRIALAKELLKLKADNMPVTIAYDIARGKEEIALMKQDEICNEAIYNANLESINSLKLQIKILDKQIDREMGMTKYD